MSNKKSPIVFISYSHDSSEHKQWVANLGIRLRQNGVDAILDQWDLFPGEDVPTFMEKKLSSCQYALLICTKRYVKKANAGIGGVGYEKMIVTSELIKDMEASKFIPIIRQSGTREVPKFIETKLHLDFSKDDDFEIVFDELLRTIYRSTISKKPPLGKVPSFRDDGIPVQNNDLDLSEQALETLRIIVKQYDSGEESYWNAETLAESLGKGRLIYEQSLTVLESHGYLEQDSDGDFFLTNKGKEDALEKKLI